MGRPECGARRVSHLRPVPAHVAASCELQSRTWPVAAGTDCTRGPPPWPPPTPTPGLTCPGKGTHVRLPLPPGPRAVTRQERHQATGPWGELRSRTCRRLQGAHGRGGAGSACRLPVACLPGSVTVAGPAGGPWRLRPQATGDKGQAPLPWLQAIDPALRPVGEGRPWPGQTAALRPACRPGTHLPLPKVRGPLGRGTGIHE